MSDLALNRLTTLEGDRRSAATASRIAGSGFDRAMAVLGLLFVGGIYLDGWAHTTGRVDLSFFTPWHAVMYASVVLVGAVLAFALSRTVSLGHHWRAALPTGYGLSLVGAGLFLLGGLADLGWHELVGVERGFEALYSPSHLLLGAAAFIVAGGPLRAGWARRDGGTPGWGALLPALLSLLALYATLTFFTQDMHWSVGAPGNEYLARRGGVTAYLREAGLASIMLQSGLLAGVALLAIRRWRLPPGALTLVFGGVALLMVFEERTLRFDLAAAAIGAAMVADGLVLALRPSSARVLAFRVVAAAIPALYNLVYFAYLIASEGTWWSTHLWTGAVALSAAVGLLLSFAVLPPALPEGSPEMPES